MIPVSASEYNPFDKTSSDYSFEDIYPVLPRIFIDPDNSNENSIHIMNNDSFLDVIQNNKPEKEDKIMIFQNIQKSQNITEEIKVKEDIKIIDDKSLEDTDKSTRKKIKKRKYIKRYPKILNNDNRFRQTKIILINTFIKYINKKIQKIYNNNIGNGINIKKIYKIDYSEIKNVDIKSIREFMSKTLKDFFSLNINNKFTYFPRDFNKKVIEGLLKEKNEEKRKIFNNIFNKTFREWAQYLVEEKDELTIIFDEELKTRNKEFFKETIKNLNNEIQCKKSRERKNINKN